MERLGWMWFKAKNAADGLKTLSVALLFFALGLADYFDATSAFVRPVLDAALGPDKSQKIMIFLPLIFATLRFITKDKPKWMRRRDEGVVDECNQPTEH